MLWMTIGGNAIPMGFNQLGKPSIRLQSLPFQAVLPSFKEGAGTALGSVIPELAEGSLRHEHPGKSKKWYSLKLAHMPVARGRDAETIRKHL